MKGSFPRDCEKKKKMKRKHEMGCLTPKSAGGRTNNKIKENVEDEDRKEYEMGQKKEGQKMLILRKFLSILFFSINTTP